jgi:hypothetical protein
MFAQTNRNDGRHGVVARLDGEALPACDGRTSAGHRVKNRRFPLGMIRLPPIGVVWCRHSCEAREMSELLPIVVGFVLTTVLGGVIGTYLQRRSWDHQNEARLREDELRRADAVCQSVSGLLDKRRYRMLRLLAALRAL